jgi:hypothetical protein
MYLIDVTGTIREISKASPVIEERRMFNGSLRKDIEVTSNKTIKPNGVYFKYKTNDIFNNNLYVGNLKAEDVKSIMNDLKVNGVADISGFTYQKARLGKDFDLDNGKSNPYWAENCPVCLSGFRGVDSSEIFHSDPALGKMTDEELRRTVYELGDYTMQQLGNMSREELLDEYDMVSIEEEGLDE